MILQPCLSRGKKKADWYIHIESVHEDWVNFGYFILCRGSELNSSRPSSRSLVHVFVLSFCLWNFGPFFRISVCCDLSARIATCFSPTCIFCARFLISKSPQVASSRMDLPTFLEPKRHAKRVDTVCAACSLTLHPKTRTSVVATAFVFPRPTTKFGGTPARTGHGQIQPASICVWLGQVSTLTCLWPCDYAET